jgi:hypothetical protein
MVLQFPMLEMMRKIMKHFLLLPFILFSAHPQLLAKTLEKPPLPSFKKHVNYMEWIRQQYPWQDKDNAYASYKVFFQKETDSVPYYLQPTDDAAEQMEDVLENMEPWKSSEYKELGEYLVNIKRYLDAYEERTKHSYFTYPLKESGRLIEFLLPHLGNSKVLSRAHIVSAWQSNEGFQGKRFIEKVVAVLRHSSHIRQGMALIESGTSNYERGIAYTSILAAIEQNLLNEDYMEQLKDIFTHHDFSDVRESFYKAIPVEKASSLDLLQSICKPFRYIRKPRLNKKHVDYWLKLFGGANTPEIKRVLPDLMKEDPREIAADIDSYYTEVLRILQKSYDKDLLILYRKMHQNFQSRRSYFVFFPLTDLENLYQESIQLERQRRIVHSVLHLMVYFKEYGSFPTVLEKLSNGSRDSFIIDPVSNAFFDYSRGDRNVILRAKSFDGFVPISIDLCGKEIVDEGLAVSDAMGSMPHNK